MDLPLLSLDERQALAANGWFASLSPSLRHDILRHGVARSFRDGECIFDRGRPATDWSVVVRGAARVGFTSAGGQKLTLCYMRPGSWFSALTVLQSANCDYDAFARGASTLLTVHKDDLRAILRQHEELYAALLHLHARRTRQVMELIEEMMSLPLRARLASQLLRLSAGHGVAIPAGIRIGLSLTQEEMAQLLGASRQRVNTELMALRRQDVIRMQPGELVVRDRAALQRIAAGEEPVPVVPSFAGLPAFVRQPAPAHARPERLAA